MEQRQLGQSSAQILPPWFWVLWGIGGWMWGGTNEKDSLGSD